MSTLNVIDLGDRYQASWVGDEDSDTGDFDAGSCPPPLTGGFTFGSSVTDQPTMPIFDLDDPALYPEPIYSVGLYVGIVGFTWPSWGCACGEGCSFGDDAYSIRLNPALADYQGNPVETDNAITGYTAFLGWRNPGQWPDLEWLIEFDGVNQWHFVAYATAIAYKVIPPSQPPPDPPATPPVTPNPVPLIPPCPEGAGQPRTPGEISIGSGPYGRVNLGCIDCD